MRDVALGGERRQRAERVRLAQALVAPPVHDLQELHGELDVADAAAAALDLGELLAAARTYSSRRTFVRRTSSIAAGASSAGYTNGVTPATKPSPTLGSPATGRALIIAWRSHVAAWLA